MKNLIAGITLFLGYALFSASMKLGDFFIITEFDATERVEVLSLGLTLLISIKLLCTVCASLVLSKTRRDNALKYASFIFAFGASMVGVGIGVLTLSEGMISKAVVGLGGGLILASINPITAMLFKGKELSIASGANNAAPNIGITALVIASSLIMGQLYITMYAFIVIAILVSVSMIILGRMMRPLPQGEATSDGIIKGLKSPFNLTFAAAFSAVVAFFTLCFTFLDAGMVTPFLLAAIAGSFVGTVLASITDYRIVVTVMSSIGGIAAIMFITSGSSLAGMICGFAIFSSITSYMMLAFKREGATPASLSITFMLLWVFNDLFVIATGAMYGNLTPERGAILLIVLALIYPMLTALLVFKKKRAVRLRPTVS